MKKTLSFIAVLLAACMIISACTGIPVSTSSGTAAAPVAEEAVVEEDVEEAAAPAEEAITEEAPEEIAEITVFIPILQDPSAEKINEVEAAINAISEKEIGVHVHLNLANGPAYITAVSMALASGEPADLVCMVPNGSVQLAAMYANGELMDISELLDEYGQDILAELGDYINACRIGDGIYLVPDYRNYASSEYVIVVKEYLEGTGMTEKFENMTTWEEWEEIMAAIKDKYDVSVLAASNGSNDNILIHTESGAIMTGSGDFGNALIYDGVGDALAVLGADIDSADGQIYVVFDKDEFKEACAKDAEWYNNGWVYKDAPYEIEGHEIQIKNGTAAASIITSEVGVEISKQAAIGKELAAKLLVEAPVASRVVTRFGLGVPVTSSEPEAAVKFMNLLFTNSDINNIISWGIEGEDYEVKDGQAAYIGEGAEWHNQDFFLGNAFLTLPWYGNGADYRELGRAANAAAPVSPYLGFVLDTSALPNEVAAITSVKNEFLVGLCNGLYTEETYENFISKLRAADIEKYQAAAQEQLDAWLAGR